MSNTIKDGGPAYPIPNLESDADFNGMSLRDWFAGQALPAVYASCTESRPPNESEAWCEMVARETFEMADAMLKNREVAA